MVNNAVSMLAHRLQHTTLVKCLITTLMKRFIIRETAKENEGLHGNIYFLLNFSVNLNLAFKIKSINKQKKNKIPQMSVCLGPELLENSHSHN